MVKNYILLSLVCFSMASIYPDVTIRDMKRLKEAIDASDEKAVADLVKKKGLITPENRQELLDRAEEKLAYYEHNASSVWTSKADTARFIGGAVLGFGGIWLGFSTYYELSRKLKGNSYYRAKEEPILILAGMYSSLIGLALSIGGLRCASTLLLIKKSEEVFQLIKKVA